MSFFFLLLPWLAIMLVNILLLIIAFCRSRSEWKRIQYILIVLWVVIAAFEWYALRIPDGVRYMGS